MSASESISQQTPSPESESHILLLQARGGEAEALGRLLLQLRPWLKVIAESMLGDGLAARVDASDLVQQTCLSVHRRIQQFAGEDVAQFLAWVREIHHCNIRDEARRHIAIAKRSVGREVALGTMELIAAAGDSPEHRVLLSENSLRLAQATDELPPAQRTAATLRYLEGMSVGEIARHMELTPDAVTSLLRRALQNLKRSLGDLWETD